MLCEAFQRTNTSKRKHFPHRKTELFRTEKSYLICGNERNFVQSFPDHCSVRMLKVET
jgi:hypothetical protein